MRSLTCSSVPWLRPPMPRLGEPSPSHTTQIEACSVRVPRAVDGRGDMRASRLARRRKDPRRRSVACTAAELPAGSPEISDRYQPHRRRRPYLRAGRRGCSAGTGSTGGGRRFRPGGSRVSATERCRAARRAPRHPQPWHRLRQHRSRRPGLRGSGGAAGARRQRGGRVIAGSARDCRPRSFHRDVRDIARP